MTFSFTWHDEYIVRLLTALVVGAVVGFEREYRSKAAGFRTMTLICLGAALFTLLSTQIGKDIAPDRIASNIITGIGFIGAGVIFKDGMSIAGLTTAASIWITAALGMAAGAGEYGMAGAGLVLVIIVLAVFEKLQAVIDKIHQKRLCVLSFDSRQISMGEVEEMIRKNGLRFKLRKIARDAELFTCSYDVSGSDKSLAQFGRQLAGEQKIRSFDY